LADILAYKTFHAKSLKGPFFPLLRLCAVYLGQVITNDNTSRRSTLRTRTLTQYIQRLAHYQSPARGGHGLCLAIPATTSCYKTSICTHIETSNYTPIETSNSPPF